MPDAENAARVMDQHTESVVEQGPAAGDSDPNYPWSPDTTSIIDANYVTMVTALTKPGEDILAAMNNRSYNLLVRQSAQISQMGAMIDKVKKQAFYGKDQGLDSTMNTEPVPPGIMTAQHCHMLHMAMGIVGEACELFDAVSGHVFLGQELDIANVGEEDGDSQFFWTGLRQSLGLTRQQAQLDNIEKLAIKRHTSGKFTDESQLARADKA